MREELIIKQTDIVDNLAKQLNKANKELDQLKSKPQASEPDPKLYLELENLKHKNQRYQELSEKLLAQLEERDNEKEEFEHEYDQTLQMANDKIEE